MKKILLMLMFSAALLAQDKTYTLKESINLGLSSSRETAIALAKQKASVAAVSEINSQMLPKITFGAGYTRLSDIPAFEVTVPFAPSPIKIQDPILNAYNLKLSVEQPLFTGFRLSSLKNAAELKSEAASVDYNKSLNEKALAIYYAFWNYYKADQVNQLVKENLASLKNHLRDTEKFLEAGLVTENDLLKLKVRIANVELKLIDSRNAVKLARRAYNKELGLPLNSQTNIAAVPTNVEVFTSDYESLITEAVNNRPELESIGLQINAGKETVDAANSGWYPQVFAFGNFYYSKPNQRIMPLEDEFADTWDLGVGLQWSLWDWGNTSAKAVQAEQTVIQAENSKELLIEGIKLEVYKNYLSLLSSTDKVEVNKLAVESAKENYRITQQKYNQQLATSTELVDSEVELLDAETGLAIALVDYELAKVVLNKSVGRIIY